MDIIIKTAGCIKPKRASSTERIPVKIIKRTAKIETRSYLITLLNIMMITRTMMENIINWSADTVLKISNENI